MTWRRLEVLIEALARTPGTHLYRALTGDDWTLRDYLLAAAVDALHVANWQRQGKRGAPRPKSVTPQRDTDRSGDTAGRSQQDIDGLLSAMRTGTFGEGGE